MKRTVLIVMGAAVAVIALVAFACDTNMNSGTNNGLSSPSASPSGSKVAGSPEASKVPGSETGTKLSSTTPAGDSVYKNEASNLQFEAPKGWSAETGADQTKIATPDGSVKLLLLDSQQPNFDTAVKERAAELSKTIKNAKPAGDARETTINKLPGSIQKGTGEYNGTNVDWEETLINAKKPVIVLAVAQSGTLEKHREDLDKFLKNLKPIN